MRIGDRILEIDGRSDDLNVRLSGQPGRESELVVLHVSGDTTRYSIDHTEIDGVYRNFELFSLFGRGKDGLWVNTSLGNILRFSPEYNALDPVTRLGPTTSGKEASFIQALDGSIWIATSDVGKDVARFMDGEWSIHDLYAAEGTNLNNIINQTRDRTIWVGGHKGLLHAFRDGIWRVYESYNTPLQRTRLRHLVETEDDNLIVANTKQVFRIDIGSARVLTFESLAFFGQTTDRTRW